MILLRKTEGDEFTKQEGASRLDPLFKRQVLEIFMKVPSVISGVIYYMNYSVGAFKGKKYELQPWQQAKQTVMINIVIYIFIQGI